MPSPLTPRGGGRAPVRRPPPRWPRCPGAWGLWFLCAAAGSLGVARLDARPRPDAAEFGGIPAFSRQYRTSCATCHVAPGKLNAQGEAFRLNGYRFPEDDARLRQDEPVPLGAEPWKELWPEAIWPGTIPGGLPLAMQLSSAVRVARDVDGGGAVVRYRFPESVRLVAATTLGDGIAALAGVAWQPQSGVDVTQAKVMLQDPLPFLPPRALNLWIGAQSPVLLGFADPGLDRAARTLFLWQSFRPADYPILDPTTGEVLTSESRFRLVGARPTIELNGLAAGRLYYAVAFAQPSALAAADAATATDVFIKLRYKWGGLGLDGAARAGTEGLEAWGGQLLDTGITLEHFLYLGETPLGRDIRDRHRSAGAAARIARGRAELAVGHVRGRNSRPWAVPGIEADRSSTFARAEHLFFPWLLGSLKLERLDLRATAPGRSGSSLAAVRRVRLLPGAIVLIRQNVRAVGEAEIDLRDRLPADSPAGPRQTLWLRLDVAF